MLTKMLPLRRKSSYRYIIIALYNQELSVQCHVVIQKVLLYFAWAHQKRRPYGIGHTAQLDVRSNAVRPFFRCSRQVRAVRTIQCIVPRVFAGMMPSVAFPT